MRRGTAPRDLLLCEQGSVLGDTSLRTRYPCILVGDPI